MKKTNSLERTLIDTLTFLSAFTVLFAFSNLAIHGFFGHAAPFMWYLTIVLSTTLYHFLYYDSSVLKIKFARSKHFDSYLALIPLLPLLLIIVVPQQFPTFEFVVWFGSYVLLAFLLCVRHAGIYTHSLMKDFARFLFIGSCVLMGVFHIIILNDNLKDAVPIALAYLLIPMITVVLLLHLLRIDRRTEGFLKKEFTLVVVFLAVVAIVYFSGILSLVEYGVERILKALENILRFLAQFFPQTESETFEIMPTFTQPTTETTSTTNTFTFPSYTGTIPTTTEFERLPLKPMNYWFFIVPLLIAIAYTIYIFTKKQIRTTSDLFFEERERMQEDSKPKAKERKLFQKKTNRERVRSAYARFLKHLTEPSDTTTNLEQFSQSHPTETDKVGAAEHLTETYRKARYIDTYDVSEDDVKSSESQIKQIERKH